MLELVWHFDISSFAAGICYNCGESGHIQRNCPEADADSKKCYRYARCNLDSLLKF